MNEQDNNLINEYFDGLCSAESQQIVRQRVETDPDFASAYALRQKMDAFLQAQPGKKAVQTTLETIGSSYFKPEIKSEPPAALRTTYIRRWLAVAALAILLLVSWWLLRPAPALYEQYAMHAPLHFTERGSSIQQLATDAESAFQQKNYAAAQQALAQMLAQNPDNSTARLYSGICLIELNRTNEAITALAPLTTGQTALKADALWYTALAHIKTGNHAAARSSLVQLGRSDEHYEQAQELLKVLN